MRGKRCAAIAALWLSGIAPAAAGVPPGGFQETPLVTGIPQITGFEWAPDGDLWILSKLGTVYVLHPGSSQPVPALALNVDTQDERGLVGIAVDPGYAVNGHIYLFYTKATVPARNRVSRFHVVGDRLEDETPLLEGPDLTTLLHNSGCMLFGTDGLLYIAMGNNARPGMEQRLDNLLGKILRIAPDGSIPPGNPLVGTPGARGEIWAYGLRNPWRFSIQPLTGTLFIGDVGDAGWEELDLGVAGANYGYPLVEGPEPAGVAGMTYPIFSYPHDGASASITAGAHMVAGNFPSLYVGDYFYGDYARDTIFRLGLDANNAPTFNEPFVAGADSPVHIRIGPDGALYYASILQETIFRVAYVGGTNQLPVAAAEASATGGLPPLLVQFDGSASFDPDGGTLTYQWFFGDETPPSTAVSPAHLYTAVGTFYPNLNVSDGQGSSKAKLRVVSGNRPPIATILSPADGSRFNAGDLIGFSGAAADPEEGSLGAGSLSWTVLFHHGSHTHPFWGPTPGIASGALATMDAGETDPDVWYEIRLTAADSGVPLGANGALDDTKSVAILPNLGTMSFAASPRSDLTLALDGKPFAPPRDVVGVVGVQRPLEALSPQTPGDGHTYVFSSWSDSGPRAHTIVTPASATFTASFACDVIVETTNLQLSHAPGGEILLSWDAPADPCLSTGPVVYQVYAASSARPSVAPGDFPTDPPFALRASTGATWATFVPGSGAEYYLVVAVGSDSGLGPVGHYGR